MLLLEECVGSVWRLVELWISPQEKELMQQWRGCGRVTGSVFLLEFHGSVVLLWECAWGKVIYSGIFGLCLRLWGRKVVCDIRGGGVWCLCVCCSGLVCLASI